MELKQKKSALMEHSVQSASPLSLVESAIQQTSKRMVNGYEVAKIFNRFIAIQKSYCIVLGIQIFLTVIYYELDYIEMYSKSKLILCSLTLMLIPSIILSILSHITYNDLKAAELKQLETLTVGHLIFKCIVILIQPIWFVQDVMIDNYDLKNLNNLEFKLNYVLVLGSLLKFFILIPCLLNLHKFKNPRASRVSKIYGCPNSNLYTIKCCFRQSPILLIICTFLLGFLIFSFAYRVSERNLQLQDNSFQHYANSIWLVVITMSAVGFGDFAPKTAVGRTVGLLCTFCGVLTVSIMVVVVINTFQLDQNETKSLRILKKLEEKKEIKKIAASYLRISLWRVWCNRKKRNIDRYCQIDLEGREQKLLKTLLKQKIRISKFTDASSSDLGIQMNRQFEKIQYSVENLQENSDQILNYLSNKYFLNLEDMKEDSKTHYGFNYGLNNAY